MSAVTDITVLESSNNPYIYPSDPRYLKVPVDLNQGAGGDYLYLAYLRDDDKPITALFVSVQPNSGPRPPAGYTAIDVDLNKGAGGKYIYLCYAKDSDLGSPVTELSVLAGGDDNPPVPEGWTLVPGDLNEGAGGSYVYLIHR